MLKPTSSLGQKVRLAQEEGAGGRRSSYPKNRSNSWPSSIRDFGRLATWESQADVKQGTPCWQIRFATIEFNTDEPDNGMVWMPRHEILDFKYKPKWAQIINYSSHYEWIWLHFTSLPFFKKKHILSSSNSAPPWWKFMYQSFFDHHLFVTQNNRICLRTERKTKMMDGVHYTNIIYIFITTILDIHLYRSISNNI